MMSRCSLLFRASPFGASSNSSSSVVANFLVSSGLVHNMTNDGNILVHAAQSSCDICTMLILRIVYRRIVAPKVLSADSIRHEEVNILPASSATLDGGGGEEAFFLILHFYQCYFCSFPSDLLSLSQQRKRISLSLISLFPPPPIAPRGQGWRSGLSRRRRRRNSSECVSVQANGRFQSQRENEAERDRCL